MSSLYAFLIGGPNTGKTSLFNQLTGLHKKTGNWSGVTVGIQTGTAHLNNHVSLTLIDLPGIYSLKSVSQSLDEKLTIAYVEKHPNDIIINVVDIENLSRNLYLTLQLLELNRRIVIVLISKHKPKDVTKEAKILQQYLHYPVLPSISKHQIKNTLIAHIYDAPKTPPQLYPEPLFNILHTVQKQLQTHIKNPSLFTAIQYLTVPIHVSPKISPSILDLEITALQQHITEQYDEDPDIVIAEYKYKYINYITEQITRHVHGKKTTKLLDSIFLHRWAGLPLFLVIMYFSFVFIMNISAIFQDFVDVASNALFVNGLFPLLQFLHIPREIAYIVAVSVGKGLSTTLTFMPVIFVLFLFLSFLEESGYMTRATFIMDRIMRVLGLPGKSFIPMIVGFGCNVPAVMAGRTLENKQDRFTTVLMVPFMSCGARLAIFSVFTAAFFPNFSGTIVFLLYVTGVLVAIFTGFLLKNTSQKDEQSTMLGELPNYTWPNPITLLSKTWFRLKGFIIKAGKFIIPITFVLSMLNVISPHFTLTPNSNKSILAEMGKWITPIFYPMGITQKNWPATVGLITGITAKEVVIGTLNTLYSPPKTQLIQQEESVSIADSLRQALATIPSNVKSFFKQLQNPFYVSPEPSGSKAPIYGYMEKKWPNRFTAFAYLLFVLLYMPCIATIAAVKRELNVKAALFSIVWGTGFAYIVATNFYQTYSLWQHPWFSLGWISASVLYLGIFIGILKKNKGVFQWVLRQSN